MSLDQHELHMSPPSDGADDGVGFQGGGSGNPGSGSRDRFAERAEEYHRSQAVRDLATSLEDVATQLDHQARNLRVAARTIREEGKVHILETVIRELMWLNTKLGVDRFFVLYGEFSRNFE